MKTTNTIKTISAITLAVLISVTTTNAIGSLTPSGTAGDDTQYSLNDIYDKLTDFSDTPTATSSPFSVPETVSASFRTLTEIYELLEAEDSDLVAGNIADGVEIFGVTGSLVSGLPKTGQTECYTGNAGATTTCPGIYDDGGTSAGVAMSYEVSGDIVTDNVTGLVWQKSGAYLSSSWSNAVNYCHTLALDGGGWRLPNIKELQSIVGFGRTSPMIDTDVFTDTPSNGFWSSTTYHGDTSNAWYINFGDGDSFYTAKTSDNVSTRCVR